MTEANSGDLTKHRDEVLKALEFGRSDVKAPPTAWPTIETAMEHYQADICVARAAHNRRWSKERLEKVISLTKSQTKSGFV
jgi:hypothetical protein